VRTQYKIARKFVRWELLWCMWTDGRTK